MQAYRPSDRVPMIGLLLLFAAAILGGGLLGLIVYFVSRKLYLVLVFPFLIGLLAGMLVMAAGRVGKVRSPAVAMFFGLLVALVTYGSFRYFEYSIGFKKDLHEEMEDTFAEKISDEDYEFLENLYLQDETGSKGFVGYIKMDAEYGFQITRTTSSSDASGMTIKGVFAYGYWIVEFLLIAGTAIVFSMMQARVPFSEETNEWFGPVSYVATIPPNTYDSVMSALQQGDFARVGDCLYVESSPSVPRVEIGVRRSSKPEASVALGVRHYYRDKRGNLKNNLALEGIVHAPDLNALTAAIRRRV